MKLTKDNHKWKNYQTNDFIICYRYKNSISGNNDENKQELIYLITWSADVTIKDKTETINAPAEINIPANTYHKIKALTDISFILKFPKKEA